MSPRRSKATRRPSRDTSTFIQVPLSTAMRTWRVATPGGASTFHFAVFAGGAVLASAAGGASAAAVAAGASGVCPTAGGPGRPAGEGGVRWSGFSAWFSGAWVGSVGRPAAAGAA